MTTAPYVAIKGRNYDINHSVIKDYSQQRPGQLRYVGLRLFFGKIVAMCGPGSEPPYYADHELRFDLEEALVGFVAKRNSRQTLMGRMGKLPFPIDMAKADEVFREFLKASSEEERDR